MEINKLPKYLSYGEWYHGTTLEGWKNICKSGVIAAHNVGNELDFGYGFYLTPKKQDAEKYITNLLKFEDNVNLGMPLRENKDSKIAVLIEFNFRPIEWYEENKYSFEFFNKYDDNFAEFVFHNRLNNINGENQHNYDVIFGVMSDSLPMILIQKYKEGEITRADVIDGLKTGTSNKQLSLHLQNLCDIIKPIKATIIETGEELNVNEYVKCNGK